VTDFYYSVNLGNSITLCIAPITDSRIEQSGQELLDTSGYFLFQISQSEAGTETKILAQVLSDEGVDLLRTAFNMA
jgi:hypothetical protein